MEITIFVANKEQLTIATEAAAKVMELQQAMRVATMAPPPPVEEKPKKRRAADAPPVVAPPAGVAVSVPVATLPVCDHARPGSASASLPACLSV